MKKINADDVSWITYASPGGKFTGSYKELSLALGAAKNKSYAVTTGDVIIHPPGDAHQIINTGEGDLTYILIAESPPVDICRYPDSNKVGIFDDGDRRDLFRATEVDYFDGEE